VLTDRDQHDLIVEVTGLPPGASVRLLQCEIREPPSSSYTTVNVLRDETLEGTLVGGVFETNVSLDTSLPCFARIEVRNSLGGELVFSNPIHFVREVPSIGVPPERAALRLDSVRMFLAESFRLRGAVFDAESQTLTIQGDEEPTGLGSLAIDPGVLGAPATVAGADAWSYLGGVLSLQGFSGEGSSIEVDWGATDLTLQPTRPHDLELGSARPNPFGAGTIVPYTQPREGTARLTIFDVQGRRVRTLELGSKSAGHHEARWDGANEQGFPLAAGVYWLRLEFEGETRMRRAVKLR
jgi:hypothetical protein